MKQSAKESLMLWSLLAIVFGVTYGIGTSAGMRTDDVGTYLVPPSGSDQAYSGPSSGYTSTPNPESLTYSESGRSSVTAEGTDTN